jgi:heat shock transcription factor, other eukaryote
MASQGLSKKRPAPGTSPAPYQNSYQPQPEVTSYAGLDPHASNDQFLQFGYQPPAENAQASYSENSLQNQPSHSNEARASSNQLARRPANQMIPRDRGRADSSDPQWTEQADGPRPEGAWGDNLDTLRQRAQVAKREAQSKRKQIPPFVQKLAR